MKLWPAAPCVLRRAAIRDAAAPRRRNQALLVSARMARSVPFLPGFGCSSRPPALIVWTRPKSRVPHRAPPGKGIEVEIPFYRRLVKGVVFFAFAWFGFALLLALVGIRL